MRRDETHTPSPAGPDWMGELAMHYEHVRRAYPDDVLAIVFDIDGTILDMRYLMVHTLLAFDRGNGTDYFRGLGIEEVDVHENRIEDFLVSRRLPAPVRADVATWFAGHIWTPEAVLAGVRRATGPPRPSGATARLVRRDALDPDGGV